MRSGGDEWIQQMSQRVFPQLRMTNWKRTRAFYAEGLGFNVDWEHQFEFGSAPP